MSIANLYFIPCVFRIIVFSIIILLCFVKFKSLRNYRRRRNWAIYGCLIILSLVFYQAYDMSLGSNYVSFSVQKAQSPILSGQQSQFSVTCTSSGVKQIDFYLVILSENASLEADGQQGYIQANATAIKIPFSFHGSGAQTKPVYFTADTNVSSISFYPSVERINNSPMNVWVYISEIQCTYNPQTQSFAMADSDPTAVP